MTKKAIKIPKKSGNTSQHDTLVKSHFQHPENVLGLIELALDPRVFALLKTETLQKLDLDLSTPALLKSITDLLFACELQDNSKVLVHIVLEHKSYPDNMVAIQLLKYMALIWDYYRRTKKQKALPFIIPLVFYHGKKKWNPKPLPELFPKNSLLQYYIPNFIMPVCNLQNISKHTLFSDIGKNTMLLLLKSLLGDNASKEIAEILDKIYIEHPDMDIVDKLELFMNYLAEVRPEITIEEIDKELAKLPSGVNMGKSFKEQWAEYSFKQGEIRGEARGIYSTMLAFLTARFTKISSSVVDKLSSIKDINTLNNLVLAIPNVESIEEFDRLIDKAVNA